MTEAKIEIRTRDVKGVPYIPGKGDAQHLFIIHTDSAGNQKILRGGPVDGNMLFGNLEITSDSYTQANVDWVQNNPSVILATGTDAEMSAKMDEMGRYGQVINDAKLDYKTPTFCSVSFIAICHTQNSNTLVRVQNEEIF